MSVRQQARGVAAAAAIAAAALATPALSTTARAAGSAKPGRVGAKVMLVDNTSLVGVDAATDASGTTYIGWIGTTQSDPTATRQVFLCALPPGSSDCKGGVQTVRATVNGAKLTPGKVYSLVGKVVFTKGGVSRVGTSTLKFRSCVNP